MGHQILNSFIDKIILPSIYYCSILCKSMLVTWRNVMVKLMTLPVIWDIIVIIPGHLNTGTISSSDLSRKKTIVQRYIQPFPNQYISRIVVGLQDFYLYIQYSITELCHRCHRRCGNLEDITFRPIVIGRKYLPTMLSFLLDINWSTTSGHFTNMV